MLTDGSSWSMLSPPRLWGAETFPARSCTVTGPTPSPAPLPPRVTAGQPPRSPERGSAHEKATVTGARYQPLAFGGLSGAPGPRSGGVLSTESVSDPVPHSIVASPSDAQAWSLVYVTP